MCSQRKITVRLKKQILCHPQLHAIEMQHQQCRENAIIIYHTDIIMFSSETNDLTLRSAKHQKPDRRATDILDIGRNTIKLFYSSIK